jgi:hypothetical protein
MIYKSDNSSKTYHCILGILHFIFFTNVLSSYLASSGESSSNTFTITTGDFLLLLGLFLIQLIPLMLYVKTELPIFRKILLISLIIVTIRAVPQIGFLEAPVINIGFFSVLNQLSGVNAIVVIILQIYMFMLVKGKLKTSLDQPKNKTPLISE